MISKDAQKKTGDIDSSDEELQDAMHKLSTVTKSHKKMVMLSEPILASSLPKSCTVNSPAWDIEEPGLLHAFFLPL